MEYTLKSFCKKKKGNPFHKKEPVSLKDFCRFLFKTLFCETGSKVALAFLPINFILSDLMMVLNGNLKEITI